MHADRQLRPSEAGRHATAVPMALPCLRQLTVAVQHGGRACVQVVEPNSGVACHRQPAAPIKLRPQLRLPLGRLKDVVQGSAAAVLCRAARGRQV